MTALFPCLSKFCLLLSLLRIYKHTTQYSSRLAVASHSSRKIICEWATFKKDKLYYAIPHERLIKYICLLTLHKRQLIISAQEAFLKYYFCVSDGSCCITVDALLQGTPL